MWNILDTDFGGDETANFGPRKETGTALYQIDTIATVSCQDQVNNMSHIMKKPVFRVCDQFNTKVPHVSSSVLGDLTSLAVHTSLVLQSTSLLGFDQVIEEIEWSPDGSLIIIGVSEGILYVVDAQSTESLFSFALVPEDRRIDGKSFKKILFSGTADLVVLTADGQIVVQSGIEVFKQVRLNLHEGQTGCLELEESQGSSRQCCWEIHCETTVARKVTAFTEGADIQSVIKDKIKIVESSQQHSVTHDLVLHGNYIFTLGGGDSVLAKWNYSGSQIELEDETESLLENDAELLQGKLTTDGHYLIALDSNNHISLWDTNVFVCVKYWNDMKVTDICLLEQNTSQNNSLQDMKLVVLTVPEDGHCNLKVQSLPDWETVYNLQLNAPSMLAKCNTFQDALYLTEFCSSEEQPDTVSMVRFRCLNETDPITRLYRILQKNKFEEAENFAKMFQLDIELVHKVKTNYLINELSPWNVGKYTSEQVMEMTDQLWVCLDTIADNLHTAESCIRAALPTFSATQSLLTYCKTRLNKVSEVSNKDPTIKDKCDILLTKLLETQHRLITFKMTYGEENFTGEIWEQFMRADMLQESLSWMDRGHLDTGFIIWTRHQAEWTGENQLTSDIIQKVLSTISHNIPATSLQGQLSVGLIPTVVREVPEAMVMVVNFIIEKTQNMELADKTNWPGSAVRFAQFLYTRLRDVTEVVIDQNTCMAQDSANKTKLQYEVVLQPLHTLIVKLQQLEDVLHKYKFRLTLAQFLQETRETIAFRMLDRVVALELITSTLERQIRPYMKEHGLNQDEIFSKYIKDLLERSSQIRSYSESSWEAKAVAIIGFISDLEQKIEGILEVMKWAPIPWSTSINDLIQEGLKLKHPRVSKLKEQCDRVHVRKLMLKYGLKNVEVPQGGDAEHLMYVMLIQDKRGCMEDAIEIMKSCNVKNKTGLYTFRLRQLIATNRIEEAIQLLRSLMSDLGVKAATELLNYAIIKLDYTVMISGAEEKINLDKRLFTEAAVHVARYLQGQILDQLEVQDLKLKENMLVHLLALQVEYDIYLTTDQYLNDDHKMSIIFTFLKDFIRRRKQCPTLSYAKVYRLADILQISHTKIQGQLAIESASNGDIQKAVEICGELYESDPSEETAATLYEVAQSFLYLQSNVDADDVDTNKLRLLPELCYRLANQATAICSADKLCQYLELSKTCSLLLIASQQCESGASTLSSEWGQWGDNFDYSSDQDQEMFGAVSLDVFQEDAVLMNSAVVLPLVSQYATNNPLLEWPEEDEKQASEEEPNKIENLCNHVLPVVQHLRENSHQQLAYLFSVHMLNTLTQYIQQQDMGLPIQSEELCNTLEQDRKQVQGLHQTSQSLLKELIGAVVMKIFNCSKVDVNLALTFLCSRPKPEVLDIMMKLTKASGHQYKRLKYVAVMGIALGQLLREAKLIDNCQMLETDASWGYRLSKMKISFQEVFLHSASSKHKILPAIAQSDTADCELVKEFCQAYRLDEDEGLLLYLDHLFIPPDDAVYVNTLNRASILSKAKMTVNQIIRKDELLTRLQKLYYRTSSYDYETLEFILEVMQELDDTEDIPLEKGLKLLGYLKVYTRHSEPSEYEMEYKPGGDKKELQIVMSCLPAESKTRLPIHPLLQGDAWKIITPELNRETIATWLLIAKLLCLSDDQICLTAVQNMVRVYSQTFLSPDAGSDMSLWNWSSESANLSLLKEVNEVLRLVKNCENSLACAKWMVTKLPMGSEKVLVLKECIRLAELWHQSIPEESGKREKAKAAYLKFLKHWQKMASAQALCQHGLGEAELLQMTEKPSVVIQRLYEHPSITVVDWDTVKDKPGIHEAAEAIAHINKVELTSIQNGLIQKWLQSSNHQQAESDTTMTFNLANLKFTEEDVAGNSTDDEEHNFKRLVHLLKRGKQEEKIEYACKVVEYACKPSENQDMIGSIRALRCLLHLYDDDTLKQLCNKSTEDLRHLMHIMIYLVSLEKLHIKHSVQTFLGCQKEGLVRGIWKNHSHEKTAVTLVSCLCLDYKLYDKQLWTNILQRLHQFGLMKQLEYVLRRLGNVSELWCIPSFGKMWQAVITAPLNKVCCPLSVEQTDTCVHYFNLMLSCPVLKEIDLDALSKSFWRLELSSCAVGCLLMVVTPQEDKIKDLLRGHCIGILDNTSTLLHHGLDHGIAVKVQEAVYQFMQASECFKEILETSHQQNFISFCVRNKSVDSLLQFAVMNQRVSEAKALVDVYISAHTDVLMKLQHYMDYEDNEEENESQLAYLKAYLRMQKLDECVQLL